MCRCRRPALSSCSRSSASVTSAAPPWSPVICRLTSGLACLGPRDLQAAPIRDGLVSHVTVTDRHHPLCGQLLPLVSLHSARGLAYIVVALPDGRRRSLRRASTDLAGTAKAPLYDGPRISVGTLLPLARHIVACLAVAVEEVIHDDYAPPVAEPAPLCATGVAAVAALAEPAERDANADRPSCRGAAAPDGAERGPGEGDVRC